MKGPIDSWLYAGRFARDDDGGGAEMEPSEGAGETLLIWAEVGAGVVLLGAVARKG